MTSRPVRAVLLLALCAQLGFAAWQPPPRTQAPALGAAPPAGLLRVAALGDEMALARFLMLWLQAADGDVPLRALDYRTLRGWLDRIADLDPRSHYPLAAASQVYAAVGDPARVRVMLSFVHARFLRDPDRHWPWMAHAALAARHRLHDAALAAAYAQALRQHTAPGVLPPWAEQMEAWFAADMNELDSARALIGGLITSGRVTDPRELRLLERRLQELEGAQR